jgi:hypothetical protein
VLTAVSERESSPAGAQTAPPVARSPHAVLQLQRAVGNRAVGRMLARCGAGGCTCGGACKQDDELLLEDGRRALGRAVAQR